MRDIKRIGPFLEKLGELWKFYPDLRFGQLIYVLTQDMKCGDIFFPEESVWEEVIQIGIDEIQAEINKQSLKRRNH